MGDPNPPSIPEALQELVATRASDQGGATNFTGLTYQVSYTFDLILEALVSDEPFWILLDYHNDTILIKNGYSDFYQIKTRRSYLFKWPEITEKGKTGKSIASKMYLNLVQFGSAAHSILISNRQFEVLLKSSKIKPAITPEFTIDDLKPEIRNDYYEHISAANNKEIMENGHSLIVDSRIMFKVSDLPLDTHETASFGKVNAWLETRGYCSATDNQAFYRAIRNILVTRYKIVLPEGKSAESKVISSSEIVNLLNKLCRTSHSELRKKSLEIVTAGFPIACLVNGKRWLDNYAILSSDPNNEKILLFRKYLFELLDEINLGEIESMPTLVQELDKRIVSKLGESFSSASERQIIIVYEVLRAADSDELSEAS